MIERDSDLGSARALARWLRRPAATDFSSRDDEERAPPGKRKFALARAPAPACEAHALPNPEAGSLLLLTFHLRHGTRLLRIRRIVEISFLRGSAPNEDKIGHRWRGRAQVAVTGPTKTHPRSQMPVFENEGSRVGNRISGCRFDLLSAGTGYSQSPVVCRLWKLIKNAGSTGVPSVFSG